MKIEHHYKHPVIHVKDASRSVSVVASLMRKDLRESFVKKTRQEYAELRTSYTGASGQIQYVTLQEARNNRLKIDWSEKEVYTPNMTGIRVFEDFNLEKIRDYISWVFFFVVWELKGKFPEILNDPVIGAEAGKLFRDANRMLDMIIRERWLTAKAVTGIFPANSVNDDIEIYADENRDHVICRFINLRNQVRKNNQGPNYCLADFIAPKESGIKDYLGAFAVTAGLGIEEKIAEFQRTHDDYSIIMLKALADRLSEAFTELLHEIIRKELWGFSHSEELSVGDLILEKYQGIRPAHGYPACPDHSEKETLFSLLKVQETVNIRLTEHYSMYPAASVSGLIFAHPASRYFSVGKIGKDQLQDYALRKNVSREQAEKWLASNLNYVPDNT